MGVERKTQELNSLVNMAVIGKLTLTVTDRKSDELSSTWLKWQEVFKKVGGRRVELMSDLEIVYRSESSSGHTSTPLVGGI